MEEEQTKAAPPEKPGSVEAELVAAKRMERIAKEKEEKDPQMIQLNELLRLAQQHDLPGVDPNSVSVRPVHVIRTVYFRRNSTHSLNPFSKSFEDGRR